MNCNARVGRSTFNAAQAKNAENTLGYTTAGKLRSGIYGKD
jgi:hypothetical protein